MVVKQLKTTSSMQGSLFSWIICVFVINLGTFGVADVETVLRKVGENVTMECPELLPSEKSLLTTWEHDGQVFATKTSKKDIANFKKDQVQVSFRDDMTLVISPVSEELKGKFVCTVEIPVAGGNTSSKTNEYNLVVQDAPDRVEKPKVLNVTSSQITVSWDAVDSNNSPIKEYHLKLFRCNEQQAETTRNAPSGVRQLTIDGLNPFTCYTVSMTATNDIGTSRPSVPSDEVYTEQDDSSTPAFNSTTTTSTPPIPKAVPGDFKAVPFETEIQLMWTKPKTEWSGEMLGYEIRYGKTPSSMKSFKVKDPDSTETTLGNMKPYTMYTVAISVYNSVGNGQETATEVRTLEGAPSTPRITHISSNGAHSFYVHWEAPLETNGKLYKYKVKWSDAYGATKARVIAGHLTNPMAAYITHLQPYLSYNVQVSASTRTGGYGQFTKEYPALTEVTAPSHPRNLSITEISKTAIHLKWEEPKVIYKKVDQYLIKMWDHRGDDFKITIPGRLTEHTVDKLRTDSRYNVKVAGITYALFKNNTPFIGDWSDTIFFTLGDYGTIISIIDDGKRTDYGTVISIVDSKNDELKKGSTSEDDGSLSPVVITVIVCVVIILVVAGALFIGYRFYTCRRCYQAAYLYLAVPSNGNSVPQTNITVEEPSEEKQYPDIIINDFISHVDMMHMDSDIAFAQEFDEINRASNTDKYSCEHSNGTDNRMKNRYINIIAYDHSRVVLKTDMGRPRQSDYINANYVDGYKKPKAYIATQGPLPLTFPDFWRMVWEQNTSVIVMITNLMEKGRRKCDQYWPNDGTESYGNIQVKLVNTVPRAHYTVRIFTLKNLKVKKRHSMKGTSERTVYHYHYTEWPDHGVPDYSLPVLDFVQKSAADSGPDAGPIVVHCSAGVGRTGTYILIDSMIAQIQDKKTINIPGFTQFIRRQRNYLVQTEDQYIFIHSVLVEYLLGGGATEVKEELMSDYLSQLEQPPTDQLLQSMTETSLLSKQFQLVTCYRPSEADLYAAHRECNLDKNREGSLHPVNLKRVLLPARPGVEGSDYINASYLQGYERSGEFVVTQHPKDDTVEDFWRMVWDRNSTVIVVLSPMDGEEYKEFWPGMDNSTEVDAGNFRLAMKEGPMVDEDQGFTTYEFILDSIQYDYTLMTRIVCVRDWPASCAELHRVFDVIATAHEFINSTECGPVVVMDQIGGTAAGAFCALWTLRDQVLSEKCADFYQLAKLYHYKRPGILGTEEDYFFLHKAMAALCRQMNDTTTSSSTKNDHHHHHNHNNHRHYFSLNSNSSNNHNNTNNHNNHNNHHNQNGTLPRAANASSNSNNNSAAAGGGGLPRSSTIAGSGGGSSTTSDNPSAPTVNDEAFDTLLAPTAVDSSTTNALDDNNSSDKTDTNATSFSDIGPELEDLEATLMNEINSRNSYVNADTGEAKVETNI